MVYQEPGPVCKDCIDEIGDFELRKGDEFMGTFDTIDMTVDNSQFNMERQDQDFEMNFDLIAPQKSVNKLIRKLFDDAFQEESGIPEFFAGEYISCNHCHGYIHEDYYEEHIKNQHE